VRVRGVNFAIRDQKVGIQWVSQNIAAFGGDPSKITVGGQSAGGSSAHIHVLEAKLKPEKPLFRHAFIQSGAAGTLGPITLAQADVQWEKLCEKLEIGTTTAASSRLEKVLNISAEKLLQATLDLHWDTYALVEDKLTMTVTGPLGDHDIPFAFDLGKVSDEEEVPYSGSIAVLIGDTDTEVSSLHSRRAFISNTI